LRQGGGSRQVALAGSGMKLVEQVERVRQAVANIERGQPVQSRCLRGSAVGGGHVGSPVTGAGPGVFRGSRVRMKKDMVWLSVHVPSGVRSEHVLVGAATSSGVGLDRVTDKVCGC